MNFYTYIWSVFWMAMESPLSLLWSRSSESSSLVFLVKFVNTVIFSQYYNIIFNSIKKFIFDVIKPYPILFYPTSVAPTYLEKYEFYFILCKSFFLCPTPKYKLKHLKIYEYNLRAHYEIGNILFIVKCF